MAPRIVLIADYNDDNRIIYSTMLQHGGFVVIEARNGAEALEMIPKHRPSAVVTELALTVIDGCEVLQRLKQHPQTSHIPVLIVTADGSPGLRQRAEAAGCDAYLLKPCTPRELLATLCAVLDKVTTPSLP
jgi:two-component system, cell cycle response regulator DivK